MDSLKKVNDKLYQNMKIAEFMVQESIQIQNEINDISKEQFYDLPSQSLMKMEGLFLRRVNPFLFSLQSQISTIVQQHHHIFELIKEMEEKENEEEMVTSWKKPERKDAGESTDQRQLDDSGDRKTKNG